MQFFGIQSNYSASSPYIGMSLSVMLAQDHLVITGLMCCYLTYLVESLTKPVTVRSPLQNINTVLRVLSHSPGTGQKQASGVAPLKLSLAETLGVVPCPHNHPSEPPISFPFLVNRSI
jgi:hypothetical protein